MFFDPKRKGYDPEDMFDLSIISCLIRTKTPKDYLTFFLSTGELDFEYIRLNKMTLEESRFLMAEPLLFSLRGSNKELIMYQTIGISLVSGAEQRIDQKYG